MTACARKVHQFCSFSVPKPQSLRGLFPEEKATSHDSENGYIYSETALLCQQNALLNLLVIANMEICFWTSWIGGSNPTLPP